MSMKKCFRFELLSSDPKKLTSFSNNEDDIQSQQNIMEGKVVSRYIIKKIDDNVTVM